MAVLEAGGTIVAHPFSFREPPYRVRAEFDLAEENAILQEKIFAA